MATNDKNRKSEAQERIEEADDAGRFAGNDQASREAMQSAVNAGALDTARYGSGPTENGRSRYNPDRDRQDRRSGESRLVQCQ